MLFSAFLLFSLQSAHQVSSIHPQGYFNKEYCFADADGDGDLDLYCSVFSYSKRYIDIYYQENNLFSASPDLHIALPENVIGWSVGNFLEEEAGSEIVFAASRAIYVRKANGRAVKLAEVELLIDVPNTYSAPYLDWVTDIDNDGLSEMFIVAHSGYKVIEEGGNLIGSIPLAAETSRAPLASPSLFGGSVRPKISSQELSQMFIPNEELGIVRFPPSLYLNTSLPRPVWVDVNNDQRKDLCYKLKNKICIHLQKDKIFFDAEPDLSFELDDNEKVRYRQLEWLDLDGTGTMDLLLVRASQEVLSQTRPWQIQVFLNPFLERSLQTPHANYKIQSSMLSVQALDVNEDGLVDICTSNWSLDLGLLGRGSPQIKHVASAFLAIAPSDSELKLNQEWSVRPAFTEKRSLNVDSIDSFVFLETFSKDLTGDQRPDFLELSEKGSIRVREFASSPGGFSVADSFSYDLPLQALEAKVYSQDLNGDGVFDLIIEHTSHIEMYLSI